MSRRTAKRRISRTPELPSGFWDRLTTFMPPGAPDVTIAGVSVARATISQQDEHEEDGLAFTIFGSLTGSPFPPALLFGDVAVRNGDWFVGATAVAILGFRDPSEVAHRFPTSDSLVKTLGPWASNVLYDRAASAVRAQVAGSPECEIEVPYLTPEFELRLNG